MKSKAVAFALAIIVVHAAVVAVHGLAHAKLAIALSANQQLFVAAIVLVFPLAVGILLFTELRRAAGALLAASMAAALLFGLYNHFLTPGRDNFFEVPVAGWGAAFRWTSVLLAVTEALGCWAGVRVWKERSGRPPGAQ